MNEWAFILASSRGLQQRTEEKQEPQWDQFQSTWKSIFIGFCRTDCGNGSSLLAMRRILAFWTHYLLYPQRPFSARNLRTEASMAYRWHETYLYVVLRPLVHYAAVLTWFPFAMAVAILLRVHLLAEMLSILSRTRLGNQIVLARICSNSRQNEKDRDSRGCRVVVTHVFGTSGDTIRVEKRKIRFLLFPGS